MDAKQAANAQLLVLVTDDDRKIVEGSEPRTPRPSHLEANQPASTAETVSILLAERRIVVDALASMDTTYARSALGVVSFNAIVVSVAIKESLRGAALTGLATVCVILLVGLFFSGVSCMGSRKDRLEALLEIQRTLKKLAVLVTEPERFVRAVGGRGRQLQRVVTFLTLAAAIAWAYAWLSR